MDISSSVPKTGKTLTNAVSIQVQASLDNAVAASRAAYQSLGLVNKPTPLDVMHEFAALTATIDQATSAVNVFPLESVQGDHILEIAPKGVALCAALARTTAALKSLSGPVSEKDGVALLKIYEEVQIKTAPFFPAVDSRAASFEHGASGVVDVGLSRFKELYHDLAEALSAVLPNSLHKDKVQELHTSIQTSVENSLNHSRNLLL